MAAMIDVWLTFYEEIADERLFAAYDALLSADERTRQHRFRLARDRSCYLVTRALVRTVLSRYLPLSPKEWRFATDRYGRPHIANPCFREDELRFNISHTQGLIALAVARGREIGIDAENIGDRAAPLEVAGSYFAPQEIAALLALPSWAQHDRFFVYWTLKESYIKARGLGLTIPLHQFAFRRLNEDAVELEIDSELRDDARRWQFWQFQPSPRHLVALCAQRVPTQAARLAIRRIVPLDAEEPLAVTMSLTST